MRSRVTTAVVLLGIAWLAVPEGRGEEAKPQSVEALAAALKPSICVITIPGRDVKQAGLGTGFVINADGLIATNAHVIGEGRKIGVEFADGKKYDAIAVYAHDHKRDLAIIKIDAKGLKPIPLGDSDVLKDGQSVVALGNPKGLKYSVVSGVVSGVREIDGRKMIQVAMPVEPGNSGGPLVDQQGRVQGVITLKSLVTDNLGFAGAINELKALLKKPNSVPMAVWVTLGALDPDEWKSELGAFWTQRAGRLQVEGLGTGFGGRSICIAQRTVPATPYEVSVSVKLDDEAGAAGLLFQHDGERHYGFYPTGGKLRFTHFEGPDVNSWRIMHDAISPHYKLGEWNTLKVRVEKKKALCYVNNELVLETAIDEGTGQVGLAKFRQTKAEFKNMRIVTEPHANKIDAATLKLLNTFAPKPVPKDAFTQLSKEPSSPDLLRAKAKELEQQAAQLKALAAKVHESRTYSELHKLLQQPEATIDLLHAALLLAKLDNEEVDVPAYRSKLERMAKKLHATLPKTPDDAAKLKALNAFFFEMSAFHGSRGEYYTRSNSYLNEVLDDREGLPITLSVVYLELARRIDLPIVGVGLPGHFMVRHQPKEGEGKFIDVFDRGALLTVQEAKDKVGGDVPDALLKPVTKKAIIGRMLQNLLRVAQNEQDTDAGLRYLNGILLLDPEAAQSRAMRAGIFMFKRQKAEALEDINYLLEHSPEGLDRAKLLQLKRSLEQED